MKRKVSENMKSGRATFALSEVLRQDKPSMNLLKTFKLWHNLFIRESTS